MSHLHATRKQILDAVDGLSPAQWNFKPDPRGWSVAECVEHLALSEDALMERIRKQILQSPPAPDKRGKHNQRDRLVMQILPDRTQKTQAPGFLQPANRWKEPSAAVAHFKTSRDRNIAWIEKTQDDLRAHFAPHPSVGELDAYQWVLVIAAHTERHFHQINEIKAAAAFPGS